MKNNHQVIKSAIVFFRNIGGVRRHLLRVLALLAVLLLPTAVMASGSSSGEEGMGFPAVLLFVGIMLLFARIGAMVERLGQPAVLGELLMGVLLGALAFIPGLHVIDAMRHQEFIVGLAEFGVILLLFSTGLESNLNEMVRVGGRAFSVATVGVILPFAGGFYLSRLLLPEASFNTHLFLGATLTATSVGITARVFKDLNVIKTLEAKIVLGAAVIDDVMGLLILAIVSGIVSAGTVSAASVAWLSIKAAAFLGGSIAIGLAAAPKIGAFFSRIHSGVGMKMAIALLFCLGYSYAAEALAGLAPIVGAFAAGLLLDAVHFREFQRPEIAEKLRSWSGRSQAVDQALAHEMTEEAEHQEEKHVENLIQGVSMVLVPLFFLYTGLQVNLAVLANPKVLGVGLLITAVAFIGKVACGWAAGSKADRLLIGFSMVPRGEVGLIFANVGKQLGVVNDEVFAIAVIVVMLSTLLTPPILNVLCRRQASAVAA